MGITQTIDGIKRQALYVVAIIALVLSIVLPSLVSAATVTDRSIALSSASKGASNVTYQLKFTAVQTAGAFMLEFCKNTPLIGAACTPSDIDAGEAASTDASAVSSPTDNQIVVTKAMTAGAVTVNLTGITNPTTAGTVYARLITYDTATNAGLYEAEDLGDGVKDTGSIALSITDTVGVSGAVLETMTFCVSGGEDAEHPEVNPITASCGGNLTTPSLVLGKDTNGVVALDAADVYEGTIYTQLSTNAVGGAIVSLKSGVECGGLHRSGAAADLCDIAPAGTTGDIAEGEAKFGLKLGANVTDATDGDLVAASANYSSSNFRLNYDEEGTSGVTSLYGDQILTTNSKPANNRNMPLTFGASVANNTPGGSYSADLSLIATGKF